MAAIRPFAALRYHPTVAGELSRLIAPPYDVIDPEEQEQLYGASDHNIIRLILGKQSPADSPSDNRYTRAKRDFAAWRTRGILRQDASPAYYLIEHAFQDDGATRRRLGFIALLQLDEATRGSVYRHEATLAAPREDRTKLLEAVPANLEPIFCVYPDAGAAVQALLEGVARRSAPTVTAELHGESIRLWAITDGSIIQDVTRRLEPLAVLIADGHHRFEVAFANRNRYGAVMSYFASMEDPALRVRPIHRLIQGPAIKKKALEGNCLVEPAENLSALTAWLSQAEGHGRFGLYDGSALYRVTVKPERMAGWLMAPSVPLPVATLDVSLLHGLLLPALGVNGSVRYVADASQALDAVRRGEGGCAWLLRGIPLAQVYALASQGMTLAPKSTYFYPKVPSGLVINPHPVLP